LIVLALVMIESAAAAGAEPINVYVDAARGRDTGAGAKGAPLKTIGAAINRLAETVDRDVTIHLAPGRYATTGGSGRDGERLELSRAMREGVRVKIRGAGDGPPKVVLDWPNKSAAFMMVVTQGHWVLEKVQLGTRQRGQRQGISVRGPALLEVRDVRIRTGSRSGPGLHAHRGGRIHLYGTIELNEDLHDDRGEGDSFCSIMAEFHGVVRFRERKKASLSMGNGNLDVRTYGIVELGCEWAQITSWGHQSNAIAINDSGRVGLKNTTTTLRATDPRNTPIGLEHDGHVMAEGAKIIILGCGNNAAIVLQKASSFFCNDVEIKGTVGKALEAMSGSTLLVGILGDLGRVQATTGSHIIIEKVTGNIVGDIDADKMARVLLPDGRVVPSRNQEGVAAVDPAALPPLHKAAYGGHSQTVAGLIDQGADVNAAGPNGRTPLHYAAMGAHLGLIRALLAAGADLACRDGQGRTPAEAAEAAGHSGTAAALREMGSE